MEEFVITKLDKLFRVDGIFTVHYFEFGKNYEFSGEKHNFWEIVYADKGEMEICAENAWKQLAPGSVVFHRPMEFHSLRANGTVAPNAAVVTFECHSDVMSFFDDKICFLNEDEKKLLGKIISEAQKAFTTLLDDPYTKCLTKRGNVAAEQLMGIYLEELLLSLYLRNVDKKSPLVSRRASSAEAAIKFMDKNVDKRLCISDIAAGVNKSESELKRIFKDETGMGVMTYFRQMKINYAKRMLREKNENITEIAMRLGYNDIHHFSKQFKGITGMSPSEYAVSIKSRLDEKI